MARERVVSLMVSAAIVVTGTFAMPAVAGAHSSSSADAHALLKAEYAFARATKANFPAMRKQMAAEERRILKQCPHGAAGSPQDSPEYKQPYLLAYEATGALWSVGYGADSKPIAKLVRAVHHTSWHNAALARLARQLAGSLHKLATLAMPPVCADIASWRASGYTVVPSATKKFDRYTEAIEIPTVHRRLLARYLPPADRSLLKRTEHLRTQLLNFETEVGGNDWYSLVEGLDIYS